MENRITVSYFKCDTKDGNELFIRIKDMLEKMDWGEKKIEVNLQENNPFLATEAYLCDDVVIFDGSLEDPEENAKSNAGQQYDAMIEPMKTASHVLIVSRSQIPFNVMCVRKGGYPNYIRTGTAEYKDHIDNDEILKWIKSIFMQGKTELLNSYKLERNYYRSLTDQEKAEIINKIIKENVDETQATTEEDAQVFVSYLSRYSKYFSSRESGSQEYTVEDLIEYISETQGIPLEQIGYFPPGNLSRELMTVQRRWEIISVTDDFIRKCRQFWILDTPGYAKSWWTLSERVTLSYIYFEDPQKCPDIYVAKYDTECGGFQIKKYLDAEAKKSFLPKISQNTKEELARYFANSRPGGVGYESIRIMKLMHHLPDSAVRFLSRRTYKMMEEIMPAMLEDIATTMAEYEETAIKSSKSDVYTKAFWEDWVMECPYCKMQNSNSRYNKETFLHPQKSSFCHVVKKHDLRYDAGKDRYVVVCKKCKHKFYFNKGFFYRWYPLRGGNIHTGPEGKSIEKKTAFYFTEEKQKDNL